MEAQWPICYGVGLRIKRSSVRIRPWPLRWVLGQGSLLPLSQGETFTLASISYLAILVKYILAKKKKNERGRSNQRSVEKWLCPAWELSSLTKIIAIRTHGGMSNSLGILWALGRWQNKATSVRVEVVLLLGFSSPKHGSRKGIKSIFSPRLYCHCSIRSGHSHAFQNDKVFLQQQSGCDTGPAKILERDNKLQPEIQKTPLESH